MPNTSLLNEDTDVNGGELENLVNGLPSKLAPFAVACGRVFVVGDTELPSLDYTLSVVSAPYSPECDSQSELDLLKPGWYEYAQSHTHTSCCTLVVPLTGSLI